MSCQRGTKFQVPTTQNQKEKVIFFAIVHRASCIVHRALCIVDCRLCNFILMWNIVVMMLSLLIPKSFLRPSSHVFSSSSVKLFSTKPSVATTTVGEVGKADFRIFFQDVKDVSKSISPWHDIPLLSSPSTPHLYNMITEIPKFTKQKYEVSTTETLNPIAQDVKKGKLRDYHGPIFWNYGCLPQTWEDPNVFHPFCKAKGDNDPLDVVEIGSRALSIGSVTPVKPLGILAMIDDGELDWKLIVIANDDPLAAKLNDVADVDTLLPGTVSGVREWFRWYKTPDGKPLNAFSFDEVALDRKHAIEVIEETHDYWKKLRQTNTGSHSAQNNKQLWIRD